MKVSDYMIASRLRGFKSTELRVRVLRINDNIASTTQVEIITADLCDAGTRLWLDADQLSPLQDAESPVYVHPTALVAIG